MKKITHHSPFDKLPSSPRLPPSLKLLRTVSTDTAGQAQKDMWIFCADNKIIENKKMQVIKKLFLSVIVLLNANGAFAGNIPSFFSGSDDNGLMQLASGSSDNTIRLWDMQSGTHKEFKGHENDVNSVAFSPKFWDSKFWDYKKPGAKQDLEDRVDYIKKDLQESNLENKIKIKLKQSWQRKKDKTKKKLGHEKSTNTNNYNCLLATRALLIS